MSIDSSLVPTKLSSWKADNRSVIAIFAISEVSSPLNNNRWLDDPPSPLNSRPKDEATNVKFGSSVRPTAIEKPVSDTPDRPRRVAIGDADAASITFTNSRSAGIITGTPRSASIASSSMPISTRSPRKTKGLSNENAVSKPVALVKCERSEPTPTLVSKTTASP